MYYKKYEGDRIYLSPIDSNDYQTFTRWINDETLARGLGNFKFNFTEQDEKEYLENSNKNGNITFAIVRKEDNKMIGSYGLIIKDNVSRRIHIGGFIGDKEDRGKGYGTEALKLLSKYCFEILNAESLYSGIFEFNEASLKAAKKAGYSVAGKYRNAYYYGGRFYDEYCIEMIREEYEKNK